MVDFICKGLLDLVSSAYKAIVLTITLRSLISIQRIESLQAFTCAFFLETYLQHVVDVAK